MTDPRDRRRHADDLRGAGRLAVEATQAVTTIVEDMHRTIGSGPIVLGAPLEAPMRALTSLLYGSVRGVTGLVGKGVDKALLALAPVLGDSVPGPEREAVLSALNGVVGDVLAARANPLALPMELRVAGRSLVLTPDALRAALPQATPRVLVAVHGSCMNDLQWEPGGAGHPSALAQELGATVVALRYNSGLHVSDNGRGFAALLEALVAAWPVPVERIELLAHSMGGLVCRSALHVGASHAWRRNVTSLITLGPPHHGAPLERGGNWLGALIGVNRYSAPIARLGRLRSAGVTDLRHGSILEEDWRGHDRFAVGLAPARHVPLPDDVQSFALAATTSSSGAASPAGDGLVPVTSALGQHTDPARTLRFTGSAVVHETTHLGLLRSAEVQSHLRTWLTRP